MGATWGPCPTAVLRHWIAYCVVNRIDPRAWEAERRPPPATE